MKQNHPSRQAAFNSAARLINANRRREVEITSTGAVPTLEEIENLSIQMEGWVESQEDARMESEFRLADVLDDEGEYDFDEYSEHHDEEIRLENLVVAGRAEIARLGQCLEGPG